jgi:hypothetical protein
MRFFHTTIGLNPVSARFIGSTSLVRTIIDMLYWISIIRNRLKREAVFQNAQRLKLFDAIHTRTNYFASPEMFGYEWMARPSRKQRLGRFSNEHVFADVEDPLSFTMWNSNTIKGWWFETVFVHEILPFSWKSVSAHWMSWTALYWHRRCGCDGRFTVVQSKFKFITDIIHLFQFQSRRILQLIRSSISNSLITVTWCEFWHLIATFSMKTMSFWSEIQNGGLFARIRLWLEWREFTPIIIQSVQFDESETLRYCGQWRCIIRTFKSRW